MATFLDVARQLYFAGKTGTGKASFELTFRAIAALDEVYAKAEIDTDNLEAVFAAFEMARLFGRLRDFDEEAVKRLPDAMRDVIAETLEQTLTIERETQDLPARYAAPRPYGDFVELLPQREAVRDITFLTFNYDLALEFALLQRQLLVDYGFVPQRADDRVLLLKLHGSMNWTACSNCTPKIAAFHLEDYYKQYPNDPFLAQQRLPIATRVRLSQFSHCNDPKGSDGTPLLVPPTWSKGEHHQRIAQVWRHAARQLSDVRNIVVIGYSMPETDHFFRYLYALGTVSDTRLERFWVIDPDDTGAVEQRFRALLGPTARARFKYLRGTFRSALGRIEQLLKGAPV